MRVNKFAEMSVRIQTERGHRVVDTGPYAFVRHPFYVATFPLLVGMPLALGSYWALDSSRRDRDRPRRADGLGRSGASATSYRDTRNTPVEFAIGFYPEFGRERGPSWPVGSMCG